MTHPGNDRSFGPLLNWDTFRSRHGAAPNRCGMISHGFGKPVGEIGVSGMECQKLHDRSQEILDVFSLGLLPASGIGFLVLFRGSQRVLAAILHHRPERHSHADRRASWD